MPAAPPPDDPRADDDGAHDHEANDGRHNHGAPDGHAGHGGRHDHGPDPAGIDAAGLHEVADGVHAWVQPDGTWWLNNAGLVIGDGAALIVDTCATEARTRRFLGAVAATTDADLAVAVNTHAHGDHTYGNGFLPAATTLVGHENMRRTLLDDPVIDGCPPVWDPVPDWGAVTRRVPDVTVTSGLTAHVGGRAVEVHHPGGTAHTDGDLVAWVPGVRVLFSGDLLFHGLTPLVFQGSVPGARAALDLIATFDPVTVVPGHGPVFGAADLPRVLAEHRRYYDLVLRTAEDAVARDVPPLEAARACDLGPFSEWDDAERLVLNLHRACADLSGRPMDVIAAFTDAIAWNDGPLTTHVCC